VYPVLVNILPPPSTIKIVSHYQSTFMGLEARQDHRVINLWEIEADRVLQQPLPTLLPFVPILKGGGEEAVVRQAVQLLRADEQLQGLEPLLSFFASFVLGIPLVQQIMRWDMTVLRESPWYQEILQEGLNKGMQQGRQEEAVALVLRLLNRRLGSVALQR
jgi:predicted transposase YdaD